VGVRDRLPDRPAVEAGRDRGRHRDDHPVGPRDRWSGRGRDRRQRRAGPEPPRRRPGQGGEPAGHRGQQQERQVGQAGHDPEAGQEHRGGPQGPRLRPKLREQLVADRALAVGRGQPGHRQRRRERHQERGELDHQAVAHRLHRVDLGGRRQRQPALADADRQPADQVDRDDQDRRDRVALHELHRAVEGAVELRLPLEGAAPLRRLGGVDRAGPQVGVDRELLTGQAVEGEPGRDLGDPLGAARHDQVLHDRDHREHDQPDDQVPRGDEAAERAHDLAAVGLCEDPPRGRHVDAEAEQGRDQEDGRQGRQAAGVGRKHRGQEDHDRRGEAHRQEQIDRQGRQRHHHHRHHRDHDHGQRQVAPAATRVRTLTRHLPSCTTGP
jgi:hypothetical protein